MKLTPQDFEGEWRISRQITDFRILESGTLEGTATFTPNAAGLSYHEVGQLVFADAAPIRAERRYTWRFGPDQIEVSHADGSAFHAFNIAGGPEATPHLCGSDMYRGTYSFVRFPLWQVTWLVKGPAKNYRSVTLYEPA